MACCLISFSRCQTTSDFSVQCDYRFTAVLKMQRQCFAEAKKEEIEDNGNIRVYQNVKKINRINFPRAFNAYKNSGKGIKFLNWLAILAKKGSSKKIEKKLFSIKVVNFSFCLIQWTKKKKNFVCFLSPYSKKEESCCFFIGKILCRVFRIRKRKTASAI